MFGNSNQRHKDGQKVTDNETGERVKSWKRGDLEREKGKGGGNNRTKVEE